MNTMESALFEQLDKLPLLVQKLGRLLSLLLKVRFLIVGDQLKLTDILLKSKTTVNIDDNFGVDTSLASRQELLGVSTVNFASKDIQLNI